MEDAQYEEREGAEIFMRPEFADFAADWQSLADPQLPDKILAYVLEDGRIPSQPMTLNLGPGYSAVYMDYQWYVEYPFNGRADASPKKSGRVNNTTTFTLDFSDIVQGGVWHGVFAGWFRHTDGWQGPGTGIQLISSIRGKNPAKDAIKSRLGSVSAQVRAYKESRFRQFGPDEMPLFGPPRGFGVMQIDTPPATARQVWSWVDNVDGGLALIDQKAKETRRHYQNIYDSDPTIPRLTDEQMKLAEYQYYNGGWYWGWNAAQRRWDKITSEPYADDALRIEKSVTDGSPPADWS